MNPSHFIKKILSFFFFLSPIFIFSSIQASLDTSYSKVSIDLLTNGEMSASLAAKFILFLAIVLFTTVLTGKVLKLLFKLPTAAGQIIGGIILGPTLLNLQETPLFMESLTIIDSTTKTIYSIAGSNIFIFFLFLISSTITVGFLLWTAGHETNIQDMAKVGAISSYAGFLGAIVPIIMVSAASYYLFSGTTLLTSSLGIGMIFAATSVSIPISILVGQKKMHLRFSKATMGAAIIDDILAVALFSVFIILMQSGVFGKSICTSEIGHCISLSESLIRMVLAFALMMLIGKFFIAPTNKWLCKNKLSHLIPPFAIGMMFLYFSGAELIGGLAGITGAYFAGLFHRIGDKKRNAVKALSPYINIYLFPLFLGSVGMRVNLHFLSLQDWIIVIGILFAATASKLIACYISTFVNNLSQKNESQKWSLLETYLFGASMVARGEVGIVIATIFKGTGIIDFHQYMICITVIVLTTIITPIMLNQGLNKLDQILKLRAKKGICTVKIGPFRHIAARQIFTIISSTINLPSPIKSIIQLSEARKVLTLSNKLKVILDPERGILLQGNENQINDLITALKQALD